MVDHFIIALHSRGITARISVPPSLAVYSPQPFSRFQLVGV